MEAPMSDRSKQLNAAQRAIAFVQLLERDDRAAFGALLGQESSETVGEVVYGMAQLCRAILAMPAVEDPAVRLEVLDGLAADTALGQEGEATDG